MMGRSDMNYIVSTELQSQLLNVVFVIVNKLLSLLYIGDLENLGLIDIDLGPILQLKVLADGNTLYVDLLGLRIGVALNKDLGGGQSDLAIITIGDSVIELSCTENGVNQDSVPNVRINLIKGNRTSVENDSVSGIFSGYDVYGGGATDTVDGTNATGYSGGFIGLNHEGEIKNSTMALCDVVRGTAEQVGPFTGINDLKSVYSFNTIKSIEGTGNQYSIYRPFNQALTQAVTKADSVFSTAIKDGNYNRYDVAHLDKITAFADLKDAKLEDSAEQTTAELAAYESPAKAVLMTDEVNPDNSDSTTSEPAETADPCKQTVDLTVTKVWKDFANIDGKRPDSITVNIYQQTFDVDGTATGEKMLYKTLTLTKDDLEKGSSTWRTVLADVPIAKYKVDAAGNTALTPIVCLCEDIAGHTPKKWRRR